MDNIDKLTTEEKEKLGVRKYDKTIYHDTDSVKIQIPKLGVCYKCGNTNGPWTLRQNGWLCEDCEVKENGKPESRQ